MSRSTVLGIIAGCLAACVLIGIYLLSGRWVEHAERQAAREAVGPALQQSVREAANEAGRKAASEMADKILAESQKGGAASPPKSDTTPVGAPVKVERKAFAITLPPGATVDPEDPSVGSERLVTADLPDHGTIIIVVADDKQHTGSAYEDTLASLRKKVEDAEEEKPESFDSLKVARATGIKGTVKGIAFRYEIGQCEGWDKGCVIVVEYPEENRDAMVAMMGKALGTFNMKQ